MAKRFLSLLMAALLLAAARVPTAAAATASPWQWRHPYPQTNSLSDIAFGAGRFVAVGENGTILSSPDGVNWTVQSVDTRESLHVVYTGGRFVITGPLDELFVSADGIAWSTVHLPDGAGRVQDVAYGNGRFVALGYTGWITSTDGLTWQFQWRDQSLPDVSRIAYGAGKFVAAGQSSVLTSTDGSAWSERLTGYRGYPSDMLYTGDRFAILGSGGLLTSPDGSSWQQAPLPPGLPVQGLAAGAGRLVVTGAGGKIFTLPDGAVAWQDVSPDPAAVPDSAIGMKTWLSAAAYGNGTIVAVGGDGVIFTSPDGTTWTPRQQGSLDGLSAVAYGAGRYVAVGKGMLTSTDGRTWSDLGISHPGVLRSIRFLNGRFLAVGNKGLLVRSYGGLKWEQVPAQTTGQNLLDIAFSGAAYVAVGDGGTIIRSGDGDGANWTAQSLGADLTWNAVTYAAGTFVAVGLREVPVSPRGFTLHRVIATSPDGQSWSIRMDESGNDLTGIAYGNGTFVAVDGNGVVIRSVDGETWTKETAPGSPGRIAFDGAMFVGVGGGFSVSGDGLRWMSTRLPAGLNLNGIAAHDGQYVIAGYPGVILVGESAGAGCGTLFPDVPAVHPACAAIEELAARKVLGGFPDGSFQPHQTLTRAEAAKLLAAARGWAPAPGGELAFRDVAGHWALTHGYLQAAVAHQAMQGFPDGTFKPDDPVTRAQLIKMVAASIGLTPEAPRGTLYEDLPTGDWADGWVRAAVTARLIGRESATPLWTGMLLQPDQQVTRAEAAVLLSNLASAHP